MHVDIGGVRGKLVKREMTQDVFDEYCQDIEAAYPGWVLDAYFDGTQGWFLFNVETAG